MATTSVTIYSQYDPEKDKERLKRDTGQISTSEGAVELDNQQLWREATSAQLLRAQRPPPKFVPASISYEVGQSGPFKQPVTKQTSHLGTSLSSWYRSLTNVAGEPSSNSTYPLRPSSASMSDTTAKTEEVAKGAIYSQSAKDKNNWFIQKLLQTEASSTRSPSHPPPTLTDILIREPPPLPSEPKYIPPVWIEIGPSNKGFAMLQKDGWREGEALGLSARPRPSFSDGNEGSIDTKGKAVVIGSLENQVSSEDDRNNPADVENESVVDIINLALSDSEISSEAEEVQPEDPCELSEYPFSEDIEDASAHGRRALLTPLATVLKLDRLGIGLKAKTEGPHKASVKRITHSAASLAAHARAAEQARRRRERFGRGHRGYERQKRREEDRRRDLLAYMNT